MGVVVGLALSALTACPPRPQEPPVPVPPAKATSLRMIVVDDPDLAAAIARQSAAHPTVRLDVVRVDRTLLASGQPLGADVVVYPAAFLGELAEAGKILPLPESLLASDDYGRRDILEMSRRETTWGRRVMAVPFGSPQFVLYCRADLFERHQLEPPKTWTEYQALAERFAAPQFRPKDLPESRGWQPALEPLAEGWAGEMLLARAAAYARHTGNYSVVFDFATLDPLIDGPPFVRALEELLAARKSGPEDAARLRPDEVRRLFWEGGCAMAVTWPTRASPGIPSEQPAGDLQSGTNQPATPITVRFAELPGSSEMYNVRDRAWQPRGSEAAGSVLLLAIAGRLGSVTRESHDSEAAFHLLAWLTGHTTATGVSPYSPATTFFRRSQTSAPLEWVEPECDPGAARQYAQLVLDSHERGAAVFSPRLPGRAAYMAALDEAVARALAGEQTPAEALKSAAERWREIGEEQGLERQRRAYLRDLELEP